MKKIAYLFICILTFSCFPEDAEQLTEKKAFEKNKIEYQMKFQQNKNDQFIDVTHESLEVLNETAQDLTELINSLDSKNSILMQLNKGKDAVNSHPELDDFNMNVDISLTMELD